MSQKVFKTDGSLGEESDITRKDLAVLQRWTRMTVDCPFCLLRGQLNTFATFTQGTKKHPKKLSQTMMVCPECRQKMRWKTLIRCTTQTVEEFAFWFWENAFLYRGMERTSGDSFFARVKRWRWEDRQIFWDVYRQFKSLKDPRDIQRDRDDYADYVKSHKGEKEVN